MQRIGWEKKKKKLEKEKTYGNGIKSGEIERPFFGHFDDVALERDFVVAVCGILGRDAIILQHLHKTQKISVPDQNE